MNQVTKETPHGPVILRAGNDNALAHVMMCVSTAPDMLTALRQISDELLFVQSAHQNKSEALENIGTLVRNAIERGCAS